jgi:hypothetical protein
MPSSRDKDRSKEFRDDDDPISVVNHLERSFEEDDMDADDTDDRSTDHFVRRVREREQQRKLERERTLERERADRDRSSWRDSPRKEPPAQPAAAKPESKPAEYGQGRIQYYRALQGFLQAMTEAAPLYLGERRRHPHLSEEAIKQRVASQCKEHLSLVDLCLTANNADSQDILLRYMRRALAKNLAGLYLNSPIEDIKGLVDVSKEWILENAEFENALAENVTGDNVLTIKLALFSASLKAHQRLDGLWCGHEPKEVLVELEKIALKLAKEIAYTWSKRSQITDKENLFSTALPYCLDVAENTYREAVMDELEPLEYLPSDPNMALPLFENSFESLDMGYEDDSAQELIARVRAIAMGYLDNSKLPELQPDECARWKSNFIAHIDGQMSEAWEEAASDLIDELTAMSQDEKEKYVEQHACMDFSRFDQKLKERLNEGNLPLRDITISFERIMEKARHHLAWIWGLSDSLITARSEQLPED